MAALVHPLTHDGVVTPAWTPAWHWVLGKSLGSALVEHTVENITAQHSTSLLPVAAEHLAVAGEPEELSYSFYFASGNFSLPCTNV